MPRDLLSSAVAQAREREPVVCAMTLLGASRVLIALDQEDAHRIYAEAVARAERLPLNGHQLMVVLDQAVSIGATVDPLAALDLFRRQPSKDHPGRYLAGTILVQALVEAGELERAVALLEDRTCHVGGAGLVVSRATDHGLKLRAMFAEWQQWRAGRSHSKRPMSGRLDRDFYSLVSQHWRVLGVEEAHRWLDEILATIESEPDQRAGAGFPHGVRLHSSRDVHLFHVLNILRALRQEQEVDEILARHPDVAVAAETFPLGLQSVVAQSPRPPANGKDTGEIGVITSGSSNARALIPALTAAYRGDPSAVDGLLAEAHRSYAEDTNVESGNLAPLPFWPSCVAYKRALYWAGRLIGPAAKQLLTEVPEPNLALLASVELAAGLLALDEFRGIQMTRRPRPHHFR
jgi:hypothetical protein